MELSILLNSFSAWRGESYPLALLEEARDHLGKSRDRFEEAFVHACRRYVGGEEPEGNGHIALAFLLSEQGSPAAARALFEILADSEEGEAAEIVLMGGLVLLCPGNFLASISRASPEDLLDLASRPACPVEIRCEAARGLLALYLAGVADRRELETWLRELSALPPSPYDPYCEFPEALIGVMIDFYPEGMLEDIDRAAEAWGLRASGRFSDRARDALARNRDSCLALVREDESYRLIADAAQTLASVDRFFESLEAELGEDFFDGPSEDPDAKVIPFKGR
jgi:hypothetical protein